MNKALQAAQTDEHEDNGDKESDNESVTSSASTSTRKNKGRGRSKSQGRDEWNHFQHAFHYSGFQRDVEISRAQSKPFEHLQSKWILDTGSTLRATICNPDLCENIRMSKQPVQMMTNTGKKMMTIDADVPGFGVGKYDLDQMANIMDSCTWQICTGLLMIQQNRMHSWCTLRVELQSL